MDQIPYRFIEEVICRVTSEHSALKLKSPLWNEAIRVHNRKFQCVHLLLNFTAEGFKCRCSSFQFQPISKPWKSFKELLELDHRFYQIATFSVIADEERMVDEPVVEVADVIKLLSRFHLEIANLNPARRFNKLEKSLANELLKNEQTADTLIIGYSPNWIDYLKMYLKSERSRRLHLNDWPPELHDDLLAFVCRPQFQKLQINNLCGFTPGDIKTIIEYWKKLEKPWKNASFMVMVDTDWALDFARWMTPLDGDPYEFVDYAGDLRVVVSCSNEQCAVEFDDGNDV